MLVRKNENKGYPDSLNYGLKIGRGKYIARMDADNISVNTRFERQVSFLEENPGCVLCGTWFQILGSSNVIRHPEHHKDIYFLKMLDYCAVGHPTVMFRRDIATVHNLVYDIAMEPAEDYNLWAEFCSFGTIHNIPEVLLYYRQHNQQVSVIKNDLQIRNALIAKEKYLQMFYKGVTPAINILELPVFNENSFRKEKRLFRSYLGN